MPAINWVLNAFVNVGEAPKLKEAVRMLCVTAFNTNGSLLILTGTLRL